MTTKIRDAFSPNLTAQRGRNDSGIRGIDVEPSIGLYGPRCTKVTFYVTYHAPRMPINVVSTTFRDVARVLFKTRTDKKIMMGGASCREVVVTHPGRVSPLALMDSLRKQDKISPQQYDVAVRELRPRV